MIQSKSGFTLIEMMIVISIIGILSTMALPSYQDRVIRSQVEEAVSLSEFARKTVDEYYKATGELPSSNKTAGLPASDKIIGNYVTRVKVARGGAIHITMGNRVNRHILNRILTVRPAVVAGEPRVPPAWVAGNASIPDGMTVKGENRTTLSTRHLPMDSRY